MVMLNIFNSIKQRGVAMYEAFRYDDEVKIIAYVNGSRMHVMPDIEELPSEILPPKIMFYFIAPTIPGVIDEEVFFKYEKNVPFPKTEETITIVDDIGEHKYQD